MCPSFPLFFLFFLGRCGDCRRHQFATKGLVRAYWVCCHTHCVTAVWLNGKPQGCGGYIPPHLWPVPQLTVCVCVGCLEWAATAVYPPPVYPPLNTYRQSTHTRCLHTNTKTRIDVCIPIHAPKHTRTTFQRTEALRSSSNTITLWLSALDSKSGSVNVLLCVYRLSLSQLGFIGLICGYVFKAIWRHSCVEEWHI